jgi:hypothetical protein
MPHTNAVLEKRVGQKGNECFLEITKLFKLPRATQKDAYEARYKTRVSQDKQ